MRRKGQEGAMYFSDSTQVDSTQVAHRGRLCTHAIDSRMVRMPNRSGEIIFVLGHHSISCARHKWREESTC